jgi:uncharacterized protein
MLVVDVNVLVDAYRPDAERHVAIRHWLDGVRSGIEPVALTGAVASALVRIATNRRVFAEPARLDDVLAFMDVLYGSPAIRRLEPGPRHWQLFSDLCRASAATGDRVPDAWLAALAMENRATLITADRGFGRYPGLRWRDPLADV